VGIRLYYCVHRSPSLDQISEQTCQCTFSDRVPLIHVCVLVFCVYVASRHRSAKQNHNITIANRSFDNVANSNIWERQ
jgi:hypothetical protein